MSSFYDFRTADADVDALTNSHLEDTISNLTINKNSYLKLCIQFMILNLVGSTDVVNYRRHHFEFSSCRETMSPIIVFIVVFLFTLIKRTHYLFSITL